MINRDRNSKHWQCHNLRNTGNLLSLSGEPVLQRQGQRCGSGIVVTELKVTQELVGLGSHVEGIVGAEMVIVLHVPRLKLRHVTLLQIYVYNPIDLI